MKPFIWIKRFFAWLGWRTIGAVAIVLVIAAATHLSLDYRIDQEEDKARFLKTEIAKLDRDISEITKLKEESAALLARQRVAAMLRKEQLLGVQLLDQLARKRPSTMVLASVVDNGSYMEVAGSAASYGDVVTFLTNLAESPLFERGQLLEARRSSGERAISFRLRLPVEGARLQRTAVERRPSMLHPGDPK